MDLEILLRDSSQSISIPGVDQTYEEGSFFCVWAGDEIHKYPVASIYRVTEFLDNG